MNTLVLAIGILSLGAAGWLSFRLVAAKRSAAYPDIQILSDLVLAGSDAPPPVSIRTEPVPPEILRRLAPLAALSEEELIAFASERLMEFYPAGSAVFRGGEETDTDIFLLKGTLMIGPERGTKRKVDSDSDAARFPLNRDGRASVTAHAWTDVWVLRVPTSILRQYAERPQVRTISPPDLTRCPLPPELRGSSLFYVFCRTFHKGKLDLPAFPSVAFKLRQAMREEIDFVKATKIVQTDPALATKLIQVANSPLFLTAEPAKTCQSAIARLGLVATRNLIFSMSMKGIFNAGSPPIRKLMTEVWKTSLHMSVISSVLAAKTGQVDPDKALLGGLIVRIGAVPFLSFAEKFRSEHQNSEELEVALPIIQGPVGQYLLAKWEFSDEYLDLPLIAEQWNYSSGTDRLDLADIVQLATWHSYLGTPRMADLPPISELPAYAKLKDATLTPEQSLKVLYDAKEQIAETLRVFGQ